MSSPTQRSIASLKERGFTLIAIVEKWNPWSKTRNDLFGMFDILAVGGNIVLGVQTTSGSNHNARVTKLKANPNLTLWMASNHRGCEVHSWSKKGPRGKRKTWQCRMEVFT